MSNTIKITKCDNELVLFAVNLNGQISHQICDIKSGYNNDVDVTIDIQSGPAASPIIVKDGVTKALQSTEAFTLPAGSYALVYGGLNWGGPYNFALELNETARSLANGTIAAGGATTGMIWAEGELNLTFDVA